MASYEQALSSGRGKKMKPPQLRSIEVEKAENGGHIAHHRFENNGPSYHESEPHVFGAGEGKELIAHLSKHLGIKAEAQKEGEGEMAEEGESE